MLTLTEPNRLGDGILFEEDNFYSRKKVTIISGQNLAVLTIVGMILFAVPETATADAGNTGDGTVGPVAAGANAKQGAYTLICIAASEGWGSFSVMDPEGYPLASAATAIAYTHDQINFTIVDGATDFIVGDIFTIDVAEGSKKATALDLTAVDGSQRAVGITCGAYDATDAVIAGVIIARGPAMVNPDMLIWPDGITADQRAGALAELNTLGIVSDVEIA